DAVMFPNRVIAAGIRWEYNVDGIGSYWFYTRDMSPSSDGEESHNLASVVDPSSVEFAPDSSYDNRQLPDRIFENDRTREFQNSGDSGTAAPSPRGSEAP